MTRSTCILPVTSPSPIPLGRIPAKRPLLESVTCTYCWHRFPPEDVLFVAADPGLRGDPVAGPDEFLRFRPRRFTIDGDALDPRGKVARSLACPRCHQPLPSSALEVPPLVVSLIGAPACGKTYLLPAAVRHLRRFLPEFDFSLTDADALGNTLIREREQRLFGRVGPDFVSFTKTDPHDPRLHHAVRLDGQTKLLPQPFQYNATPRSSLNGTGGGGSRSAWSLALYDNAGEAYLPGASEAAISSAADHIQRADLLLFLFDSLQEPATAALAADDGLGIPYSDHGQAALLAYLSNRLRECRHLRHGQKVSAPMVVIVGKFDLFKDSLFPLGGEPLRVENGELRLDMARVEGRSRQLRRLLLDKCEDVVSALEGMASSVAYVPVSGLGCVPCWGELDGKRVVGVDRRKMNPAWVTVPLLYALAKWGPPGVRIPVVRGC